MLKLILKILKWVLYLFLLLVLIAFPGSELIFQSLFLLMLGWIRFLSLSFENLEINYLLLTEAIVVLLTLTICTHFFLRWLYQNIQESEENKVWRWKWTLSGVSVFILMFVISIAFTGGVHQFLWLMREPRLTDSSFDRYMNRGDISAIRSALESYRAQHQRFPIAEEPVALAKTELSAIDSKVRNNDRWGNPFIYTSDGNIYTLRTYGKNGVLGAGNGDFDDEIYTESGKL